MSMENDQESLQFWSSILQSLAGYDPRVDRYPEISSPILVMSTSMSVDVQPLPASNAPTDGGKEAGPEKAAAEDGDKNSNEKSTEKGIEEEKEEGAEKENKSLGKRPRNESRNINEKRRRTDIRFKIQKLKELTPYCTKKDISSTLDSIIDNIRKMKFYVESLSVGPMLPLGMGMDFPAPWLPFMPPNYFIMPYDGFTQGESSGHDQQIVPFTKGFNNQPKSSKSM